jgi:hypothetical protein
MLAKVTRRFGITGVKVTANISTITTSLAVLGIALENVNTTFFYVLDGRGRLKEDIYRRGPVL